MWCNHRCAAEKLWQIKVKKRLKRPVFGRVFEFWGRGGRDGSLTSAREGGGREEGVLPTQPYMSTISI